MNVIGLAGPSCSGKTSLAEKLSGELEAPLLTLDAFYKPNGSKIYIDYNGERLRSFEHKELYDGHWMSTIIEQLQEDGVSTFYQLKSLTSKEQKMRTIQASDNLVVEGFLAFSYPRLFEKLDYKFFIDLPDEEILRRRKARGGRKSDDTFNKIGLWQYHQHGAKQKDMEGVVVLDGTHPIDDVYKELKSYLA